MNKSTHHPNKYSKPKSDETENDEHTVEPIIRSSNEDACFQEVQKTSYSTKTVLMRKGLGGEYEAVPQEDSSSVNELSNYSIIFSFNLLTHLKASEEE